MKIFLLLIAVYTLEVNGKHIGTSLNSTQLISEHELKGESQRNHHKPTTVIKNIIQKPRIVVTFLTNTKTLIRLNNETEPDIIPRADPFGRFLQFFFSDFIRDLTQPFAREERSATTLSTTESGRDKNDTLKAVCEKCRAHGELCCEQCGLGENTTATATTTGKTRATEGGKHKRHYFLSISGGTDKRATATNPLTTFIRSKRQDATAEPPGGSDEPEVTEETLPPGDDGVVPPEQSDSASNYLFTVTLPIFLVFVLLMVGLCYCLRSNGFCCRLFLSDPTKVTVTNVVVEK